MVAAIFTIGIWFTFTISVLVQNKVLLNHKIDPVTLSLTQSVVAMCADVILIKFAIPWMSGLGIYGSCSCDTKNGPSRSRYQLIPTRRQLAELLPICGLWYSSKLLTLYSFSLIPMSMTYTLKAISPIISCLLSYLFKGRIFNWRIYLSLVPICGGVILATVSGFQFNRLGIALGGISTLVGVLYSMGMKELLSGSYSNDPRKKSAPGRGWRRLFICISSTRRSGNLVTSTSWPILTDSARLDETLTDASTHAANRDPNTSHDFLNNFISSTRLHFHVAFFGGNMALVLHFVQKWRALHTEDVIPDTVEESFSPASPFKHVVLVLILNGALNFGASFFSYLTMSLTGNLTWQVFNTLKRLCVIVASILFFGTELKRMTIVGMFTAVFGVFCYNVIKSMTIWKPASSPDVAESPTVKIV